MYFMLNRHPVGLDGHKRNSKKISYKCFNFEKFRCFLVPTKQRKQHFMAQVGSNKGIFVLETT